MRILATSDLHGNLNGLKKHINNCDIVFIAGDFAKMTGFSKWHIYDMKKWIENKFFNLTNSFSNTQFVITPGNHDLIFDKKRISKFDNIDLNIKYPDNVHVLINSSININGLKIYGTPNVPIINRMWAFESENHELKTTFSNIPYNLDVLITHSPPYINGVSLDQSLQFGISRHFGSSELTSEIFEKKPKYVFCGHIHSALHTPYKFFDTTICNVSRVDEKYEIAYDPYSIEI